jgi:uncharacterized protein YdeI (YjbR/CyaY-like superfamily)
LELWRVIFNPFPASLVEPIRRMEYWVPARSAANRAEVIAFRDVAEFEAWLDANSDLPVGVWLKIAKKGSGVASLTSDEAVDAGLCYGWISGQRKSLDHIYYLQKYVPRRPRSHWSELNVTKVGQLTAAGRMRPSGIAEVEAAKADGRWPGTDNLR